MTIDATDGFVRVRGANENNLRNIDVDIPRNVMVAFTGISGSGKSSLAFGTLYAEAQRRYFESVAPYARRLLQQVGAPHVQEITGLPPAVALQQRRGAATSRSSVGTITTLSNLLRILYSRAGEYPAGADHLAAEAFSPNTSAGACPRCHGLGVVHDVTEELLVPDPSLSIREGAIAAWPGAWQGANLRSIVMGLGIDVDKPWHSLRKRDRDWLLFTDEQPSVLIEPEPGRIDHGYYGKFWSARSHVMHVLADSTSERMRERAMRFVEEAPCPDCQGSGLRPEALAVTFLGRSIAEVNDLPFTALVALLRPVAERPAGADEVAARICTDLVARVEVLLDLGLGYLSLGRSSTTLSPGEAQRLRIATQLRSGLFGVVYVLDEPFAGLHPADAEPLLDVLDRLKASGNTLFIVEHDLDVVRRADWVVDIGPGAGEAGGRVLHSGPVAGLEDVTESVTSAYLFGRAERLVHNARAPQGWLRLTGAHRHNLRDLSVDIPLCVLTAVTGVSGSGKSTLVTQVLAEDPTARESFDRLVLVDQRPIGRTPRSNLATYTGMFDAVRKLYAATDAARARGYGAGRFSFNVAGGRCETCQGEGFVSVELLFLPGTYAPCPTCHGDRYNPETLQITYRGKSIAEVLDLSVDDAATFLADVPAAARSLQTLREVGLGYLRLGQPATELSGGEAQRIKLATELQRSPRPCPLPARRADLRTPPRRHRSAAAPAAPARRRRQHGGPRRARPRRDRHRGLGHRSRSGRRRCRRSGCRDRHAGRHREGRRQRDRALPLAAARADMSWVRAAGVPSGCRAGAEASRQEESVHVMKDEGMTVYLAWTSEDLPALEGPWHEARLVAPGLVAVDSTESLSAVYHAIKWSLEGEASLIVVPVHQTPKSRGMAAGTTRWLRERTARQPPGANIRGLTSSD